MPYPVAELNAGIAQGQFELVYQPLIAAHSRAVTGVEALIRWRHPRRGFLSADAFLPAIERHRLMGDLTDWVVETAACQVVEWRDAGLGVPVSVNLSATLLHDDGLVLRVLGALQRCGLDARQLTLEVTETALTANPEAARSIFAALRAGGVRISVDDFGTGYASLAMLKNYAFDEVKIDRSFVAAMRQSPADAAVVKAIRELGHQLGLEVVAEGVEDNSTARLLEEIGCDVLQGFFFTRPLPSDQAFGWMTEYSRAGSESLSRGREASLSGATRLSRSPDSWPARATPLPLQLLPPLPGQPRRP